MSDYTLLLSHIELKKKQIKLKSDELYTKSNKLEKLHYEQKQLQLHEKQIKKERLKLAQEKQLQINESIKVFSKIIHNSNKNKEINSKQIAVMRDMTISCQLLEQIQ